LLFMSDLLQATGYAALVYLIFNYLVTFGSGRPLVEWINPGRKYLPILAITLAAGAYSTLLVATRKYQQSHAELLLKLINQEKANPEVVGGLSFVIFAAALLMLYVWCWWYLPRAPQTFNANPKDLVKEYRRALSHYVWWKGGLDFAMVCKVVASDFEVIAEGADDRAIAHGLSRVPASKGGQPPSVEDEKRNYHALAADLYRRWKTLDELAAGANQGEAVGIVLDLRYGALFAELLEEPTARDGAGGVGLVLFAAALNQHQVNSLMAAKHFVMLGNAIRHIRSGVVKG
jgi:hypothetical protein